MFKFCDRQQADNISDFIMKLVEIKVLVGVLLDDQNNLRKINLFY